MTFAFSKLTEINIKRSERYRHAAEKVRNVYRKTLLMNYSYYAQQLSADLNRWLAAYQINVQPKSESIVKLSWEKIKDIFARETETNIYADCEMLEEEAVRGYNTAITLSDIPPLAMREVRRHVQHIEKIRENLKALRNDLNHLQVA